jgi:hypothetical protein
MTGIHNLLMAAAASSAPEVSVEVGGRGVDTSNGTSFTVSGLSYGTADAGRYVVVALTVIGGGTITGVTLDGNTLTKIVGLQNGNSETGYYGAAIATGTSGNLVVTVNISSSCVAAQVYALNNVNTTASDSGTSSASPGSVSVTIPAGGVALAVANTRLTSTCTWANITEAWDEAIEAGNPDYWSGGISQVVGASTITSTWTSVNSPVQAVVVFEPL